MKATKYTARPTDHEGYCEYSAKENAIWQELYAKQIDVIASRACAPYLEGLTTLNMSQDRIPQIPEINQILQQCTGWSVEAVPALIPSDEFFRLLANKKFPAATFIRSRNEMRYLEEPDIFHEIFGHCPLLTNPAYASFIEKYGQYCLDVTPAQRSKLLRLFWLTIEFGLVKTDDGLKIYGGGILSSPEETLYALESQLPKRATFDVIAALRTPYKINIKQPIYYILNSLSDLHDILNDGIIEQVDKAIELKDFAPLYQ